MYLDEYFRTMERLLSRIRETQRDAIVEGAEAVAASLANKGALAVMDTGHMLRHEALCRAGGLMAISPFAYSLHVENTMDQRHVDRGVEETTALERQTVGLALDASKMRSGDVLVINSNSGRTSNVIETAIQCRERRITTIAICSFEQMGRCSAVHPSGQKLSDVADVCIDNCTPYGDAVIEVKDNEKACPGSGIAGAYVWWAIQAEAIERLQAGGVNPVIYRSVHVSGQAYIDKQREQFLKQGV